MPSIAASDPELARAIEEAERRRVAADMPTDVGARVPRPAPSSRSGSPGAALGVEEGTGLATVNSTVHPVVKPPSRAWMAVAIAGIGALLVIAIATIAVLRTRPVVAATTSTTVSSPVAVIDTTQPSVTPTAATPPSASASASVTASATVKPPAKPPVKPPPAGRVPDCRIPFTVDAKGNKHFKEECLN